MCGLRGHVIPNANYIQSTQYKLCRVLLLGFAVGLTLVCQCFYITFFVFFHECTVSNQCNVICNTDAKLF